MTFFYIPELSLYVNEWSVLMAVAEHSLIGLLVQHKSPLGRRIAWTSEAGQALTSLEQEQVPSVCLDVFIGHD